MPQQTDYTLFSEYLKTGGNMKDLLASKDKSDRLEKELQSFRAKLEDLESKIKTQTADDVRTYEMMERTVKDDPEVKDAHECLARQKSITLHDLCLRSGDNAYLTAYNSKRTAVESAYRRKIENDRPSQKEIKTQDKG